MAGPAKMTSLTINVSSSEDSDDSLLSHDTTLSGNLSEDGQMLEAHLQLLETDSSHDSTTDAELNAPVFTASALRHATMDEDDESGSQDEGSGSDDDESSTSFSQYGLLAGDITNLSDPNSDPRIFYNMTIPSSVFICGSQGSGKSHTLSCLLENALIPYPSNVLPEPLTGIVFHYDTFISDTGGSPCEAAYLSSNKNVSVRVLCAPTNVGQIKRIYKDLPNVIIEELRINQSDLNTKRMMILMAVNQSGDGIPLYMHVIMRILRDLRLNQQRYGGPFNYADFKRMISAEKLTDGQLGPLQQRMETLESFMNQKHAASYDLFKSNKSYSGSQTDSGNTWTPKAGQLTIVDLSCPCVTPEMACSLFGVCLDLFIEQKPNSVGRIVALDEAHKYMKDSPECETLTESLLGTIRLQRHIGTRVVISTQEPTISPRLLDLCSVTIVHRFTSPSWYDVLKKHLAGASAWVPPTKQTGNLIDFREDEKSCVSVSVNPLAFEESYMQAELFLRIVDLRPGQALLFAPSAVIGVRWSKDDESKPQMIQLGRGVLNIRIRKRITEDGGRSVLAGASNFA